MNRTPQNQFLVYLSMLVIGMISAMIGINFTNKLEVITSSHVSILLIAIGNLIYIKYWPRSHLPTYVSIYSAYIMQFVLFCNQDFNSFSSLTTFILPVVSCYLLSLRQAFVLNSTFFISFLLLFFGPWLQFSLDTYPNVFITKFSICFAMIFAISISLEFARNNISKKVENLAYKDKLTKLSNRIEFLQKANSHSQDKEFACLYIDLDDFSQINQLFGQKVSDKILQKFAEKLHHSFPESLCVSRVYSDEFAILIPHTTPEEIQSYISTVQRILSDLAQIWTESLDLTASMGVSYYPSHADNADILLHKAQLARSQAKRLGKNQICTYDNQFSEQVQRKALLERHLKFAINYKELEVHYQPKINPQNNQIVGMEALVRWKNSHLGFISPDEFIPIAENSGLILPIGEWILRQSLRHIQILYKMGYEGLHISVNISPRQFYQKNLFDTIMEMLDEYELPPSCLELEITEGLLIKDDDEALTLMQRFRNQDIKLALDDFGTGYSSLSYLKKYRFNTLKIDKSFIDNLTSAQEERNLVETLITLAKHMNMQTVAEGVEDKDQLEILTLLGCNQIQGWHYSKALPAKEFITFMERFNSTT